MLDSEAFVFIRDDWDGKNQGDEVWRSNILEKNW